MSSAYSEYNENPKVAAFMGLRAAVLEKLKFFNGRVDAHQDAPFTHVLLAECLILGELMLKLPGIDELYSCSLLNGLEDKDREDLSGYAGVSPLSREVEDAFKCMLKTESKDPSSVLRNVFFARRLMINLLHEPSRGSDSSQEELKKIFEIVMDSTVFMIRALQIACYAMLRSVYISYQSQINELMKSDGVFQRNLKDFERDCLKKFKEISPPFKKFLKSSGDEFSLFSSPRDVPGRTITSISTSPLLGEKFGGSSSFFGFPFFVMSRTVSREDSIPTSPFRPVSGGGDGTESGRRLSGYVPVPSPPGGEEYPLPPVGGAFAFGFPWVKLSSSADRKICFEEPSKDTDSDNPWDGTDLVFDFSRG